ncbi:NAD(+)/NADH kinase [Eggerthellaceae bacterium zg-1084]|uniref:NAD kinase n=1 Tax=Berryella wangjianweii TaxID=2734634 RepID=A0A6M8J1T8_9ACTN|nr:NAD(+)/NADH kinase [Berryella wangjianweii]NPD31465.1 NAD(+)/NADH kinase [Berryella wangjianweii]NPD33036.1 NAD(+)/NADH kinase [Eggerthellaceae bacterium zg-997]QKF07910.1 NAD(+)/NADH kinase [Berryella wangjianweii]
MNILLVGSKDNPQAVDAQFQLLAYFHSQGIDCVTLDIAQLPDASFVYGPQGPETIDPRLAQGAQLAIALGGDGTILRTSRLAAVMDTPLLGLNFGHLGFLCNTVEGNLIATVAEALAGDIAEDRRENLRIQVTCEGDEDGQPIEAPRELYALNEIAIARGASGRIFSFGIDVAGDHVARMRGDGVVVASATGSTAYALSAGGPLVSSGFRGMVVVPVAPHTLNSRALVTAPSDVVEISLPVDRPGAVETSFFIDGDVVEFERHVERVVIQTGERPTRLLKYRREGFYKLVNKTFFSMR